MWGQRENPTADTEIPIRHAGRSPRASTAQLNKAEGPQTTLWLMARVSCIPSRSQDSGHSHCTPPTNALFPTQGKTAATEDEQFSAVGLPVPSPPSAQASPFLQFPEVQNSSPVVNTRHTARGHVSRNLTHISQQVGPAFTPVELEPPAVGQRPSSPPLPTQRVGHWAEVLSWVWLRRHGSGIL